MKKFLPIAFVLFSPFLKAVDLEDTYYKVPIFICHDDGYLNCRGNESIADCTRGLVKFRASCVTEGGIKTVKSFYQAVGCMMEKHAQTVTNVGSEKTCGKGINVNLSKAKQKVMKADPEWVVDLLK